MADFIELTEINGDKVMINIDHILKVCQDKEGCYVYFDVATGNEKSTSITRLLFTVLR